MKAKPWQIALIVIGLLFGAGMLTYQVATASGDDLPHLVTLMDVTTGEVFEVNTKKNGPVMIPAANPDTGKTTLMRIEEIGGKWCVSKHDLGLMSMLDKSAPVKAFDPKTGDLLMERAAAKPYRATR